jgi:hypothetical protein
MMGGGIGIVIYIILALVLPKASTAAEKVAMRGGPVSLESFKESFSEMGQNIKKNSSDFFAKDAKPRNTVDKIFRAFGKIIVTLVEVAVKLLGALIAIIPAIAIAVLTFAMFTALFNGNAVGPASAVFNVIPHTLYYVLVVTLYIVGLIPLILIFTAGKFLLKLRRPPIRLEALIGLILFWIVAGAIALSIVIQYIPEVKSYINNAPEFQNVTRTIEVTDFTKLDLHGLSTVHLTQGTTTSVIVKGRQTDLDRTKFSVENNRFSYTRQPLNDFCFFCNSRENLDITITMPTLESIEASGIVNVDAHSFTSSNLTLTASGISNITISGTTDSLKIDASGLSKVNGLNLLAQDAVVEASGNSQIQVTASSSLSADASGLSKILYSGNSKVTSHISGHSSISEE